MPPSLPGTSTSTPREAGLPVTPTSRKRTASYSSHASPPRPLPASKASRKGISPTRPKIKLDPPSDEADDASQFMDETSEMMDNVVQYSDGADDEEMPCTSSSIRHQTPSHSAARPKPSWKRAGRAMSAESNESEHSCIGSPKSRKTYYTINDLHTNRPAERFRTDILNKIRAGDSEYMPPPDDGTSSHPQVLRLTDRWREEWSHGVQVPLHPKNLPRFETRPCDIPSYSRGPWRLFRGKYLLSTPVPYMNEDTHILHDPPPLRIYQGDRLDELWLERLNREHTTHRLPVLDLSTMLDLMNEFEIECFKNIHRIVLSSLSSPSSTLNSADMVDEDAPCDVCQIKEDNDDPMIFCDGCNVCLHLTCYGLTEIPEGHWECDMCRAVGFTRHDRLKCALCPNTGGAMKEVEGGDKWVHVSCAMWIPEIKFAYTKSGREIVAGLDPIHDQRWQLKCSICDLRTGACIQCEYRACATAFHTTCAQRSGVCDVLHEKNEADESVNFHAFCKRHTLLRKREREGASGRMKDTIDASDDEMDERSEVLRGLERAFFLHVKFEDAAKKLSVSQLHASDVYEFWKLKRNQNGGRPLISCPQMEIHVDTETPILTLESADADGEGQVMLRASDDVQHQLTPFQLKCWRFQKHVFQTADRGRLGCDMIMKRERKKLDVVNTSRDLFHQLIELDGQTGIPLSSRVLIQIVEGLQVEFTPEEIADSDEIAEKMAHWRPKKEEKKGGEEGGRKRSFTLDPKSSGRPAHSPTTKEASSWRERKGGEEGGRKKEEKKGGEGSTIRSLAVVSKSNVRLAPPSSTKENGVRRSGSVERGEGGGGSPKRKRNSNRRTVSIDLPSSSSVSSSSHSKTPNRSRLRPHNPPDDLSSPPHLRTTVSHPILSPTVVITSPESPSKLRERRDVKYF